MDLLEIVSLIVRGVLRSGLNETPLEFLVGIFFNLVVDIARVADRISLLRFVQRGTPFGLGVSERDFETRAVVHFGIGFYYRSERGARRRRSRYVVVIVNGRRRFRGERGRFTFTDRFGGAGRYGRHGRLVYDVVLFVAVRIGIFLVFHVENLHRFFGRSRDRLHRRRKRRRRRQRLVRFFDNDLDDRFRFLVVVRLVRSTTV